MCYNILHKKQGGFLMKRIKRVAFLGLLAVLLIPEVSAKSYADYELNGVDTVTVNQTIDVTLAIKNNNSSIITMGGDLTSSDSSCLKLIKVTPLVEQVDTNEKGRFAFLSLNGQEQDFSLLTATFEASSSTCEANISLENGTMYFIDDESYKNQSVSKTVTVRDLKEEILPKEVVKNTFIAQEISKKEEAKITETEIKDEKKEEYIPPFVKMTLSIIEQILFFLFN